MRSVMKRCPECYVYTMADNCPDCGGGVRPPIPARYSPEDRYGKYRRGLKKLVESETNG